MVAWKGKTKGAEEFLDASSGNISDLKYLALISTGTNGSLAGTCSCKSCISTKNFTAELVNYLVSFLL